MVIRTTEALLMVGLENYVYNLKNQVSDEAQFGGKLDKDDKGKFLDACKETLAWLEQYSASAAIEEFEEQKERLSQVAYPITTKLYSRPGGWDGTGHDEF
jgi:endoplasmic reticulum chaperone BiP